MAAAPTSGTMSQVLTGTLHLNADGGYTYTLANAQANVQALVANQVVTDVFSYTNSDSFGATSTTNLTVSITGVDEAVVIGGDFAITLGKGGSVVLTALDVRASDADNSADQLTYTVTNPVNGRVAFASAPGTAITSFTETQLEAGDVIFVHNGSATVSASFTVTVSDGTTTSAPVTVNAFVTAEDARFWGETTPVSVVPGVHINGANGQVNGLGGSINFSQVQNYDPANPTQQTVSFKSFERIDPFFLPISTIQGLSTDVVIPPSRSTAFAAAVNTAANGVVTEGINFFVTQLNGHNVINEVSTYKDVTNLSGPLHVAPEFQIEDAGSSTILSLNSSSRQDATVGSTSVLTTYDIAWATLNVATQTYDVNFQIFNPPSASDVPVTSSPVVNIAALHFTGVANANAITALPDWEFHAGGGTYVLAYANHSTVANAPFNLMGQQYDQVTFQRYQFNGTLDTSPTQITGFSLQPDLSHYAPGAVNHIVQANIPSLAAIPGQAVSQLIFTQFSAATGNEYFVTWNEQVVDSVGPHDQVEIVFFDPGTTPGHTRHIISQQTIQIADGNVQNLRALVGNDFATLVYGDDTSTHLRTYTSGGHPYSIRRRCDDADVQQRRRKPRRAHCGLLLAKSRQRSDVADLPDHATRPQDFRYAQQRGRH